MEKLIQIVNHELKLPEIRGCLLATLKDLADLVRQKNEWCSKTASHRFWDTMRFAIEGFESIPLESYPKEQIGHTIRTEEELTLVLDVMNKLWKVIDIIGTEKPDSNYLNSPLWQDVVVAATKAYNYIKEKGLDNEGISWIEGAEPFLVE
jgi:hypothetical protein